MNLKKESMKKKIFLALYIIFTILTFAGAIGVLTNKFDNAGYAVIPMLVGLVFNMLYRNSKKALDENEQVGKKR